MLDRDEDAALAEIEAALRRDDPDFVQLLEQMDVIDLTDPAPLEVVADVAVIDGGAKAAEAGATTRKAQVRKIALAGLLVVLAVALTLVVAVLFGPDLGGLVGVVSLSGVGLFAYQWLRGCPGLRGRQHPQSG